MLQKKLKKLVFVDNNLLQSICWRFNYHFQRKRDLLSNMMKLCASSHQARRERTERKLNFLYKYK
jgi:hypothetical protein